MDPTKKLEELGSDAAIDAIGPFPLLPEMKMLLMSSSLEVHWFLLAHWDKRDQEKWMEVSFYLMARIWIH